MRSVPGLAFKRTYIIRIVISLLKALFVNYYKMTST